MGLPFLTSFDEVATVFADYGASLRGLIRYKLTQQNLQPYLKSKKLQVLDIGGGSGPDAGWLAHKGHHVTLLEPSDKQREFAQRRFNFFLSESARKRIKIVPSTLDELDDQKQYDLVLVHGVAMYQSNPDQFILKAADKVLPGGLISIVEKGYYGAEARAIRQNDLAGLERLRQARLSFDLLGQEVVSFRPEDLEAIIKDIPAEVLEWSGIRVITDEITSKVSDMDAHDLEVILKVESEQGRNPDIRAAGQMLHFIARKQS